MKPSLSDRSGGRLLILSDGKPGHVSQAIAFARYLDCEYDLCPVRFRSRLAKLLSYLADRLGIQAESLFSAEPLSGKYLAIVSAGSETYYANRVLARKLSLKSVAIMLPKGYRYDFDLIVAQHHDEPPDRKNIFKLPVNLAFVEPGGLVAPERSDREYVAIIVGGDSKRGKMNPDCLRDQLQQIFPLFPRHGFWLTTSRRTPPNIEAVLRSFKWDRAIYASEEKLNPIPDFLLHSKYVFLTDDSTSMISEAVCFGSASVEILPLVTGTSKRTKADKMLESLVNHNAVHIFTGQVGAARTKIDLGAEMQRARKFVV